MWHKKIEQKQNNKLMSWRLYKTIVYVEIAGQFDRDQFVYIITISCVRHILNLTVIICRPLLFESEVLHYLHEQIVLTLSLVINTSNHALITKIIKH